jgi:GNAT superfamily N-acetyltransferase
VDLRRWRELTAAERREFGDLQTAVHGPPAARRRLPGARFAWAPIEPDGDRVVRVRAAGRLVSALVVTQRTIRVGGVPARAAGVRGVVTHPAYRRRGFGRAAMERAAAFIWQEVRPDLALLLSSAMAVPFYRSLGWAVLPGPVSCAQPEGTVSYTEAFPELPAMALAPPGRPLPAGPVDLCGPPW